MVTLATEALPFLPHETIAATFHILKPEATTVPLQQFVNNIEENRIRSTVWPPKCWSVCMQSIRTNIDIVYVCFKHFVS